MKILMPPVMAKEFYSSRSCILSSGSLFQVLYPFFNDFVLFLIENGIGIPKDFPILSFLGFGIPPLSLVNWLTLLVVILMVGSNSAFFPYILQHVCHTFCISCSLNSLHSTKLLQNF
ncbi:hypothetical protein OIU77_026238 [Salix suchowensis]|uniref:Uncharacterized protein n=1 Tax=Salix suchowensis TaxID=1278906 RepID=A0ABQ9C359_9ROSI|nr:hypothetical protein OIU77_026238 [Salix suchowensis]